MGRRAKVSSCTRWGTTNDGQSSPTTSGARAGSTKGSPASSRPGSRKSPADSAGTRIAKRTCFSSTSTVSPSRPAKSPRNIEASIRTIPRSIAAASSFSINSAISSATKRCTGSCGRTTTAGSSSTSTKPRSRGRGEEVSGRDLSAVLRAGAACGDVVRLWARPGERTKRTGAGWTTQVEVVSAASARYPSKSRSSAPRRQRGSREGRGHRGAGHGSTSTASKSAAGDARSWGTPTTGT